MVETFQVVIKPPPNAFRFVTFSVHRRLTSLGWECRRFWRYDGRNVREFDHGPIDTVFGALEAGMYYERGRRWLGVSSRRTQWIYLSSDSSFFRGTRPLAEFREILSGVRLPRDTLLLGDLEGRALDILRARKTSRLISNHRLKEFGFHWIDQLNRYQWRALKKLAPEIARRTLRTIGDTNVVLMWEVPYPPMVSMDHAEGLMPLARVVAKLAENPSAQRHR